MNSEAKIYRHAFSFIVIQPCVNESRELFSRIFTWRDRLAHAETPEA